MTPLEYGEALIATAEKWQAKTTAPEPHQMNEAGEWIGEDGKTILDDRTGKPKRNPIADKRPYPRGKVHAVIGGSVEDAMRTAPDGADAETRNAIRAAAKKAASIGPGSFDPGSPGRSPSAPRWRGASMGPGSFDPGSAPLSACAHRHRSLQWGRGLSTPEVRREKAPRVFPEWLQWGRGLSTPEVRGGLGGLQTGRLASMGPGSFDPGSPQG